MAFLTVVKETTTIHRSFRMRHPPRCRVLVSLRINDPSRNVKDTASGSNQDRRVAVKPHKSGDPRATGRSCLSPIPHGPRVVRPDNMDSISLVLARPTPT